MSRQGELERPSRFQGALSVLVQNRIRLSFAIFALFLVEDLFEGVRPHDLDSFRDAWGSAGLLLVLGGVALRSWTGGIIRKGRSLTTKGPYSLTRHPLYFGSLLIAIGICAIIDDGENIWVVLAVACLVYVPKILREEARLAARFGVQWRRYTLRTGIFFPKSVP